MTFKHPLVKRAQKDIKKIKQKLKKELRPFKGVIVEDKNLTLSVHYRMAEKNKVSEMESIFKKIVDPYEKKKKIKVTTGKKILEIRPPVVWDKGKIVNKILSEKKKKSKKKISPLYLGDDRTDEDAFKVICNKGYAVKITSNPKEQTYATYYLKNINEVGTFFKKLYVSRKGG
jgi:trehalose 6-phosphate phosphatase